jgi:hypothetical protein
VIDLASDSTTTASELLGLSIWLAKSIAPFLFILIGWYTIIRTAQLYSRALRRLMVARIAYAAYWLTGVGFFVLLIVTSADKSALTWLVTAEIALLPPVLVWVASLIGSAAGPSLRGHYLGLAYTLLIFGLDDIEKNLKANAVVLAEARMQARRDRPRPSGRAVGRRASRSWRMR